MNPPRPRIRKSDGSRVKALARLYGSCPDFPVIERLPFAQARKSVCKGGRVLQSPETIARLLAPYCRKVGITSLKLFGSIARGEAGRASDVDLIATFADNPGLRFFAMEEEMTAILGRPVHLLTRDSEEKMSNPYRRKSILLDARAIYRTKGR
jgi:predicted nucleotidyltransferase